jgi:hypothetical protein
VFVKALFELIKRKKFQLVLPLQVKNEFFNNKEEVIKEQILELDNGLKVTMSLPDFIKNSQEVKKLKSAAKTLNELKNKTIEEYRNRSFNPKSNINRNISRLFQVAQEVDGNDVIQRAYFRTLQGYPPRKGNRTFGDAIIWETLLEHCADDDLIIVSADRDYSADEESEKLHSFLEAEWVNKTNGKTVKLYKNLGKFINDNSEQKRKPITKELIDKDEHQLAGGILDIAKSCLFQYANASDNFNASLGITTKSCDCCGQNYLSNPSSLKVGSGNKCSNCDGLYVGQGKTCSRCGKHYHDSTGALSYMVTLDDRCPSCQVHLGGSSLL